MSAPSFDKATTSICATSMGIRDSTVAIATEYDKTVASIRATLRCTRKQAATLLTTLPQSDATIIDWCARSFITPSVFDHIDTLVELTNDEWSIIWSTVTYSMGQTIECAADNLLQHRTV